jgi:ribosomal protein S18 acetylase RimI-like enzyme
MKRLPVRDAEQKGALLEFAKRHPFKPHYSQQLMQRFLSELISHDDLVFDLQDDGGRCAVAVLLDKVSNPANDACLEILGIRSDVHVPQVITEMLALARQAVPSSRSGFQVGLPEGFEHLGLPEYYDTYEMRRVLDGRIAGESPLQIQLARAENVDEIYALLCAAFAANLDTSIPEAQYWRSRFQPSHFYVWKDGDQLLGFANLVVDGSKAEIRTIGVLAQARGQGIGAQLLRHCLNEARRLELKECYLTVALTNTKALGMYLRAGFACIEKFKCYRMPSIARNSS